MQIKCSQCQKLIGIADDKLPRDRDKAMIKCPGCQKVLVFAIPPALRNATAPADRTVIATGGSKILPGGRPRVSNPADQSELPLKTGKNVLGREADLSFPGDRYISRKHCLIEVIEKSGELLCILTDDGSISDSGEPSTNGTFHNDTRLTRYDKVYLNHLDRIKLGHTEFIFKND
jgi:pSer/pThr/pTyr-binding forkhead associated (FHA) protein